MRDSSSGSTLAIIEKEPTRKPAGGCIGIFLHLFDWKKKKQFSRKLLPPVNAAKRALKRLGGQEKFAVAVDLKVSPESRGGSCSHQDNASAKEMCAPTMIARLMGLESMPKTTRLLKNRRAAGKDALRLEMSLEEQHRAASVFQSQRRSPRRRKARLREVATRILEPGLQSRNASKFGIANIAGESDTASRRDLHVGSCANCGSLVEVMNLRVCGKNPEELDREYRGSSSSSSNVGNRERRFNTRNGDARKNQLALGIQNHSSDHNEANVIAGASSMGRTRTGRGNATKTRRRPADSHHIASDKKLSGGDFLSQKRIEKELPIKSINGSKKEKQIIFLSLSSGRRHVTRSTSQLLLDLRDKLSHLQDFQTDDCFPGINSLSILSRTSSFEKNFLCSSGYLDFSHQTFTDEQTAKINQNIQETAKSRTRVKSLSCDGETDASSAEASASSDSCCCCRNHNRRSGFKKEMECHSPENCTKMEERIAETDDSETLVDINSSKLSDEAQEVRAKCNVATMLAQGENLQRQLLLDCMVESLDSLYDYFCHKSHKAFVRCQSLSKRRLAELVEEKIMRWQHMDSKSPVELAKQEIQRPTNLDWLELMTGRIELSKNIEEDTLALMINELVVDFFRC